MYAISIIIPYKCNKYSLPQLENMFTNLPFNKLIMQKKGRKK